MKGSNGELPTSSSKTPCEHMIKHAWSTIKFKKMYAHTYIYTSVHTSIYIIIYIYICPTNQYKKKVLVGREAAFLLTVLHKSVVDARCRLIACFWLITSLNHLHINRWTPQYWWIQSQLPVYKNSSVARTTWDPNLSQESLPVCVIYHRTVFESNDSLWRVSFDSQEKKRWKRISL